MKRHRVHPDPVPSQGPPGTKASGQRAERRRGDRLAAGNILLYVVYALLLHLLFFGLSAFSDNLDRVIQVREIPVELMGVEKPSQPPPRPPAKEPAPAEQREQQHQIQKQAKVAPAPAPQREAEQEPVNVSEALEALDTSSSDTVYRKGIRSSEGKDPERNEAKPEPTVERRKVSLAAAATRAAGRKANYGKASGRDIGRGGLGEGFGVKDKNLPVISGGAVFGSGKRGALRGVLCFIPIGTKRLSDVQRCNPEGVMYTNMLNISKRRFSEGFPGVSERYEWFAIDYNGRFTVSKAGVYKFRTYSDDGSLLWVNGKLVVQNDGTHGSESKVGKIELDEGKHRIRVFYFQGPRFGIALQVFVQPPGEPERLWGPQL